MSARTPTYRARLMLSAKFVESYASRMIMVYALHMHVNMIPAKGRVLNDCKLQSRVAIL